MEKTRITTMEIDLNAFKHNIKQIKKYVGNKTIMPVIKANAYGTYINKRLDVINEFDIVAVAITDEAIELRELGYQKDVFVLNQPYVFELDQIVANDIIIGLSCEKFLDELLMIDKKIRIHLEIETGMNRTGIKVEDLPKFINKIKTNSNIIVEGVYTHLSSADYDSEYTNQQLEIFQEAVKLVKENFDIKYVHASASNGLLNYPEDFTNLVRPGYIMYGYESFEGVNKLIDLKPVCKLKSKITFIKDVDEGSSISYSRTYQASKNIKVATIPIGYADGLRRCLSNKGMVVINGKKLPIIGKVCMDGIMVDVTDLDKVEIGDDVYIWDNNLITLDDVANNCDTIGYEIISTISSRVPRIFK